MDMCIEKDYTRVFEYIPIYIYIYVYEVNDARGSVYFR